LLPGAILIKLFKLRRGIIQSIVFTFGLSLIFNFLWVMLVTSLKINYSLVHYVLFGVEVLLFVWLNLNELLSPSEDLYAKVLARLQETADSFKNLFHYDEEEAAYSRLIKSFVTIIFLIWALTSLLWVGKLLVNNFGSVFNQWDAVVSWNRWAEEWSMNIIPSPQRYAQLVPANFSITYSFLGSADIQIFAKSFMPLFTIFTWVLIVDLALEYKKPGMIIGLVILRYMTKEYLYQYIGEGYVDVALLFFSFLTVYALLKANKTEGDSSKKQYLYLGAVFAAGTALTKQNGMLVFAFYPLLAFLVVTDKLEHNAFVDRIKFLIKPMLLGLVVLLPWYILNEYRIVIGLNSTNVEYLISADRHSGRSYLERAVRAFEMMGVYKYLLPFVLVTLPLIPKKFRHIALITIYPYTLIWTFLFSIFIRNLAMVFPFLALISGMSIEAVIEFFFRQTARIKFHRLKTIFYLIPLILIILGSSMILFDEKITEMQISDQKDALLPTVNQLLYDYFEGVGEFGEIMTYYPLKYLPYFEEYSIHEQFAIYKEFYRNFAAHPEVEYFLVWELNAGKEVLDQLEKFRETGAIEFLFENNNMKFYKVVDREQILDSHPAE
jgi:hypothetical protein